MRYLQLRTLRADTTRVLAVPDVPVALSSTGRAAASLPRRDVAGTLPSVSTTTWTPAVPEFSAVANALSLLMPALEPYVLRTVRHGAAQATIDGPTGFTEAGRMLAADFVVQESMHQREHRAFNAELTAQVPALREIERAQGWVFRRFRRTESSLWGLAFAAGAEAVAFFTARWVDHRHHHLLADADGDAARLFVWHLAEEVEHKNVAFDVYRANGGGRLRYLFGIIGALIIMATSVVAGSAVLLIREGHWWKPRTHARMIGWSCSFVFEVLPMLGLCLTKDHHPANWRDPEWLASWLVAYDASGAIPTWNQETLDGIYSPLAMATT